MTHNKLVSNLERAEQNLNDLAMLIIKRICTNDYRDLAKDKAFMLTLEHTSFLIDKESVLDNE
jgi:hypothetical protein